MMRREVSILLLLTLHGVCSFAISPSHFKLRRTPVSIHMNLLELAELEEQKRKAAVALKAAEEAVTAAAKAQEAVNVVLDAKSKALDAAKAVLQEAMANTEKCAAAAKEATEESQKMAFAFQEAEDDVAMASNTMEDAVAALKQWELDYPTAAATKAATEIGGKVADTAANALLTSIFGESKSAKEARLKKESAALEKAAAKRKEEEAKAAAARKKAIEAKRAAEEAKARADKEAEEKAAKAAAEALAQAEAIDMDLRRKREEAEATLKARRGRTLSDTVATGAADLLLGGLGKAVAENNPEAARMAQEAREKLQAEAELREKMNKLKLFESDLDLLGINMDDAQHLDQDKLRKAFRARSRELHPDVTQEEERMGVPSVYELNAAFEALKKLV